MFKYKIVENDFLNSYNNNLSPSDNIFMTEVKIHNIVYSSISDVSNQFDISAILFDFNIKNSIVKSSEFALVTMFYHLWMYFIENRNAAKLMVLSVEVKVEKKMLDILISCSNIDQIKETNDQTNTKFASGFQSSITSFSLLIINKCIDILKGTMNIANSGSEFNIQIPID